MSGISGIQPSVAAGSIQSADPVRSTPSAAGATNVRDTVEISMAAKLAAKVNDPGTIRMDLVERVRGEIQAGTFETPQRINATVDRLMDELFPSI